MRKIISVVFSLVFASILALSLISCSTTSNYAYETEEIELELPDLPTEVKHISILGNWSGSMTLGARDKDGNYEYHGFEQYHFYENNTVYYSMKVESYGQVTSRYSYTYEWKYEDEQYYKNRFGEWKVLDIKYINEDHITIDNVRLNRN